ncbi:MAG: RNA polymerase subunit sigma [Nannocystaceae bacterium]|nr:RNA polymerase subunit sigma [Nannocystaceae bacterium]
MNEEALRAVLAAFSTSRGHLSVLTGAGISAESGIPTFRGPAGYWKVGSRNYHPQELATQEAFAHHPREVWHWYLYRRTVCTAAQPNPGHEALVRIEAALGRRFQLVTQNVDGLHTRAGSSDPYEIHGNIDRYRCASRCTDATHPLPDDLPPTDPGTPLSDDVFDVLSCPECGGQARPHVLWFDECYEEGLFRSRSAYEQAVDAALMIVVGTSGSTSLPMQIGMQCARNGVPMIDINPRDNPFGQLAVDSGVGLSLRTQAAVALTFIAEALTAA